MSSIEDLERVLLAMAAAIEVRMREAIERGAVMIERETKREIRHYQPAVGALPGWPRLRPSTLREKTRLGYSPPANPLLRTGEMRAGIRHTMMDPMMSGGRIEARVGVNGVVAVVQERGGGRVPARSYLERAARRKEEAVVDEVRRQLGRALKLP
ncbi:MAG: hypothetical protein ACREFJ_10915 [Acetobacteraceae bacterium]